MYKMKNHTMEMTVQKKKYADQLQFLRFCAFMMVFLWHCASWMPEGIPGGCYAAEAVSFFFILSGTVTGYSGYGKEVELSPRSYGCYMWKKLKKMYPLYLATMFIALMYSEVPQAMQDMNYPKIYAHAKQIIKNILMIQPWFPANYHTYNGPSWFVAEIMSLYLLNLPALKLFNKINKQKNRKVWFATLFVLLAGGMVVYCYLSRNIRIGYWHYSFPPARMAEYLCGMILGFVICDRLSHEEAATEAKWTFTLLEVLALVLWFITPLGNMPDWTYYVLYWMVPNFLLVTVFCYGKGHVSQLFRKKPLKWLGDVSFECYIVHDLVIRIMIGLHGSDSVSTLGNIFFIVYIFAVVLLVVLFIKDVNLGQKAEDTLRNRFSPKA